MTLFANCVIIYTNVWNQNLAFEITEANLFVPVVTLSTQDNAKLLQQLKSGFKEQLIGTNISQPESLSQNPNLNHLVQLSFQEINRLVHLKMMHKDQA